MNSEQKQMEAFCTPYAVISCLTR